VKKNPKKQPPSRLPSLLGVGLDNDDGHKRLTTAEDFAIVGGSAETHEHLTETAIKTFEELKHRGKKIGEVELEELAEIVQKARPR
jgi:uncharacterized protein YjlB